MEPGRKIVVHTDATTGRAIATRRGLGKVRHVALHLLWVQQRVQKGEVIIKKVKSADNPADLFTKHVPANRLNELVQKMAVEMCP